MISKIFTFLILFFPLACFSQIVVADKTSKQPLPYATVKVLGKNIGNYTDEKGICNLPSIIIGDTILVEYTGYEEAKFIYKHTFDTIYLIPKPINLPEVVVKKMNTTQQIGISKFSKNWAKVFQTTMEYAVKIEVPNNIGTYKINSIYLPIGLTNNINNNNVIVKLHVYDANLNGEPGEDVLATPIFITSKNIKNRELNEFNVSYQNIILHSPQIFVAIEVIINDKKLQDMFIEMNKNPTQKNIKEMVSISPITLYYEGKKRFDSRESNFCFIRPLINNSYQWFSADLPRFSAGVSIVY